MMLRLLLVSFVCALLAACAAPRTTSSTTSRPDPAETSLPPVVEDANPTDGHCAQCGVVERIERTAGAVPASGKSDDAALSGIVGGVLENKDGSAAATSGFQITVRLDSGSVVTVRQRALAGVRQGQRVEIVEGRAQPLLE